MLRGGVAHYVERHFPMLPLLRGLHLVVYGGEGPARRNDAARFARCLVRCGYGRVSVLRPDPGQYPFGEAGVPSPARRAGGARGGDGDGDAPDDQWPEGFPAPWTAPRVAE